MSQYNDQQHRGGAALDDEYSALDRRLEELNRIEHDIDYGRRRPTPAAVP